MQKVACVVRLRTKEPLTPEQLAGLREALDSSPVGDTFERRVPVEFEIEVA